MEPDHQTHKALKIAAEDVISNMPENVVTHILDLLPIQDAVRTSILSRNWRFNWTNISQLVFDEKLFELGLRRNNNFNDRTISRLLLYFKGAITKFSLHIPYNRKLDVADVCLWVMFLSQKGIKEFTLINMHPTTTLNLPSHLFFCLQLKFLKLENCCFHTPPTFCGFPNLLTLEFNMVRFESGNLGELITRCPLLEELKIRFTYPTGNIKPVEIRKLENLKLLSLPLCNLENIAINSIRIYQLVGCLPRLQELYLDFQNCELAVQSGPWKLCQMPTAFPCLKTLTLFRINFSNPIMLQCAVYVVWASRNLQTVNITATYDGAFPPPSFTHSQIDASKMRKLLQLRSVVFSSFIGSKDEVNMISSILACSPLLKKISIYPRSSQLFGGENRKLMFATDLLKYHRASPIAEVDIYWS